MSGGAYDYAYLKVEEAAHTIRTTSPLRKAFVVHLEKVADALREVEWVDSGDSADGDEDPAIIACLGTDKVTNAYIKELASLIEGAKTWFAHLESYIGKEG